MVIFDGAIFDSVIFDTGGVVPVIEIDTHDGSKKYEQARQQKVRLHESVMRAYQQVVEGEFSEQAAEAIRPYAKTEAAIPSVAYVDWQAVSRDVAVSERLYALLDDEEELMILQ